MADLSRVPGPGLPAGRDSAPASDSACPSGIPRPRHKALSMVLQRFLSLVLHRFLISGPDLGIDAAENSLPAAAVAATLFRVRLYFTLLQRGMVSPATVVCGIDMKRPILIFVAAKKKGPHASPLDLQDEWPACRMIVPDAGGNRMPRRRHNPKLKAAGGAPVPAVPRGRSPHLFSLPLHMACVRF